MPIGTNMGMPVGYADAPIMPGIPIIGLAGASPAMPKLPDRVAVDEVPPRPGKAEPALSWDCVGATGALSGVSIWGVEEKLGGMAWAAAAIGCWGCWLGAAAGRAPDPVKTMPPNIPPLLPLPDAFPRLSSGSKVTSGVSRRSDVSNAAGPLGCISGAALTAPRPMDGPASDRPPRPKSPLDYKVRGGGGRRMRNAWKRREGGEMEGGKEGGNEKLERDETDKNVVFTWDHLHDKK